MEPQLLFDPQRVLKQFGQEVGDTEDPASLANSLVQLVIRAVEPHWVVLLETHDDTEVFDSTASVDYTGPPTLNIPEKDPLAVRLARDEQPVQIGDLTSLARRKHLSPDSNKLLRHYHPDLLVPLKARGQLVGLLVLGPKQSHRPYTQNDQDFLQTVACQAASNLERARLYYKLSLQLRELQDAQAQMFHSARLASVGILAASVAHEINNPLFSILLRAQMLLEGSNSHLKSKKAREYITVIEHMAERVSSVVRDLLDFSRQEAPPSPTNNDVVDATLDLVQHDLVMRAIQVVRQYHSDPPAVMAISSRLQQCIMNLVLNSRDAMPEGGVLTLTTSIKDDYVIFRCLDTGVGIPAGMMGRIFDPFYTTKEKGQGTGLGLHICRKIIHEHHGTISVSSGPGEGTEFTLYLPTKKLLTQQPAHASASMDQSLAAVL